MYLHISGKTLGSTTAHGDVMEVDDEDDDEEEISEAVETAIDCLIPGLEDKDTSVRWSSAKSLARVSQRLPKELATQVLEAVLRIFQIYSPTAKDGLEFDGLPTLAEGSWHGACLAVAEMARRGVVRESKVADVVNWARKVRLISRTYSVIIWMTHYCERLFSLIFVGQLRPLVLQFAMQLVMYSGHLPAQFLLRLSLYNSMRRTSRGIW